MNAKAWFAQQSFNGRSTSAPVMIRCTICGEYRLGTLNADREPHSVFGTCLRCADRKVSR